MSPEHLVLFILCGMKGKKKKKLYFIPFVNFENVSLIKLININTVLIIELYFHFVKFKEALCVRI